MTCSDLMRKYSRYLLVLFNIFFSITGVIIISVGISAKAYYHEFDTFLDNKYFYVSDLLIIVGAIIFLIAFFGCCGAVKENSCMTTTFSTLLIIIFILEIIAGVSGMLLKNKTEAFLTETLNTTMKQYSENNTEIAEIWDKVQTEFKCCGIYNSTDWTDVGNKEIPMSCCKIPPATMNSFQCNTTNAYHTGCLQEFGDFIRDHVTTIGGVGIGLAAIQLLGILLACYLAKAIRSDYETV
ncbi:CD63 antigen-like [Anoplophora glabripennis]|uniref:CD63 antigen-like n=1 Tax=Anoplophora glabripennis TaxID=217634 RepID=UPI000C76EEAB|nr:CD63 antigen-like [Anoplophora glabripennis]